MGFGRLECFVAMFDKVGSFRCCLLAFGLRRRLGRLRVGEHLTRRLLPCPDGVDHRTEQKMRQQPDQDEGIDRL
jgi:hypothetical protein